MSIQQAFIEYLAHGFFILIYYFIYTTLPYFRDLLQSDAKRVIDILVIGYFIFALPYFFLRNRLFPHLYKNDVSKPLLMFQFAKKFFLKATRIFSSVPQNRDFLDLEIDEKMRVAVLSFIVKLFYFPLMLSFFLGHLNSIQNGLNNWPRSSFFSIDTFYNFGYFFLYNLIFAVDTVIFAFSYAVEAKWLNNEIRSVDPYFSGWAFALISYPPFNSTIDRFFPTTSGANGFFSQFNVMFFSRVVILLLYGVYVWATIALFAKSSNLTNRGIISHGPYRFIRHPAYAAKNIAWWLETLPFLVSWTQVVFLLAWNSIYVMRALTEERHLLKDKDYQTYVKEVRWRFIPGVI